MKGTTAAAKILMLIGGVMLTLLLVTSVFGRGIAFGLLGIAAESEPSFLQEELRSFLTVAATTPGEFEIIIPLAVNHGIELNRRSDDAAYIHVTPPKEGLGGFYADPGKIYFYDNDCHINVVDIEFNAKEYEAIIVSKYYGPTKDCVINLRLKEKQE